MWRWCGWSVVRNCVWTSLMMLLNCGRDVAIQVLKVVLPCRVHFDLVPLHDLFLLHSYHLAFWLSPSVTGCSLARTSMLRYKMVVMIGAVDRLHVHTSRILTLPMPSLMILGSWGCWRPHAIRGEVVTHHYHFATGGVVRWSLSRCRLTVHRLPSNLLLLLVNACICGRNCPVVHLLLLMLRIIFGFCCSIVGRSCNHIHFILVSIGRMASDWSWCTSPCGISMPVVWRDIRGNCSWRFGFWSVSSCVTSATKYYDSLATDCLWTVILLLVLWMRRSRWFVVFLRLLGGWPHFKIHALLWCMLHQWVFLYGCLERFTSSQLWDILLKLFLLY